jgi:hypothetical protein
MPSEFSNQSPWALALAQPAVWRRALLMAASVGLVQVAINQGDSWIRLAVDPAVIAKTVLTPLVTFVVALFSAAGAYVDRSRELRSES